MTETVFTRNAVAIRLTDERWAHIIEEHSELAGYRNEVLGSVEGAERVYEGGAGELLAVRMMAPDKAMVVVYRETRPDDGFTITAFVTRRLTSLERRKQVWPPSN